MEYWEKSWVTVYSRCILCNNSIEDRRTILECLIGI